MRLLTANAVERAMKTTYRVADATQTARLRVVGAVIAYGVLASCFGSIAPAQEGISSFEYAETSSPRRTLNSFIDSVNDMYAQIQKRRYLDTASPEYSPLAARILDCLDTSELPEHAREELAGEAAACLKEILDRVALPSYDEIPDVDATEAADGLEKLTRWRIPGTRITIAKVQEGPRRHEYLFSPGTVTRAVDYYESVKSRPYRTTGPQVSEGLYDRYVSDPRDPRVGAVVDWLPGWARGRTFGMAVWQWCGLVPSLMLAIFLMAIAYRLQRWSGRVVRGRSLPRYFLTIVFPIVAMLIPLIFAHFAYRYLALRGTPHYVVSFSANLTALLASLVVVFGVSNRGAELIIASPRITPHGLDAQFIRIVSKIISLTAIVIIFLHGGHYLGFPLTTLLASAGIGGLALALAAQDSLKTLFGTIMLLADKPFAIGERIIFDKYDGVIEDIGLRSTKIRMLTGHQMIIPNDELSRVKIENVGRRPHIRRVVDIHIPLDTSRDKVEKAIALVRDAIENHEGMEPDFPPRVYFFDFKPDAFIIRVIYWYHPPNYWDFLAFGEKFNLEVFRALDTHGIQFSVPTRIAHVSSDTEDSTVEPAAPRRYAERD